jgi:hypothetical protein
VLSDDEQRAKDLSIALAKTPRKVALGKRQVGVNLFDETYSIGTFVSGPIDTVAKEAVSRGWLPAPQAA